MPQIRRNQKSQYFYHKVTLNTHHTASHCPSRSPPFPFLFSSMPLQDPLHLSVVRCFALTVCPMSDNQANSGSATAEHDPPPAEHVAHGAVDAPPPPAQKSMLWNIARNMAMYFALMFIIRNFTGLMSTPPAPSPAVIDGAGSPLRAAGAAVHSNAWRPGTKYDIYVWLSSIDIPSFDLMATPYKWRRTDLTYSDHTPDSEWSVNISRTAHPELWSNVTLYAHVVMLRDSLKPERAYLRPEEDTNYVVWPLVKRYPERLANDRKKLLSGEQVDEGGLEKRAVQKQGARALLPHWVPELNIRVIFDFATFQRGGVPPQLSRDLRLTHRGECDPFCLPPPDVRVAAVKLALMLLPILQVLARHAHAGVLPHALLLHRAELVGGRGAVEDNHVASSGVEVAG